VVKPRGRGEACLLRDADEDVAACQSQADAEHCSRERGPRLGKFGREGAPDKTRVIPCSGQQARGRTSFACLGLAFRWGTNRAGTPRLTRRTARKTLRRSIQRFTAGCRETCRHRVRDVFRELNANRRGYYRYDGVPGTYPSLQQFFSRALRLRMKGLNRRRQRRSYTWPGFKELLRHFQVARPRLVGRPPRVTAEASAGLRKRVCVTSPVRETGTPGSVRGRPGHWPSYRDGANAAEGESMGKVAA
jgi:RNA-directed DNA polymerase